MAREIWRELKAKCEGLSTAAEKCAALGRDDDPLPWAWSRTDNGKSAGEGCRFPPIAEDAMDGAPGQLQAIDYSVAAGLGSGSFSGSAFVG